MSTIIQEIASQIAIYQNQTCLNHTIVQKAETKLLWLSKNCLPSGSGIDCGTKIQLDKSRYSWVYLYCGFHPMDANGYYDGWTKHHIKVFPTFDGFEISISGRNRNDIKAYLYDVYHICLSQEFEGYPLDLV